MLDKTSLRKFMYTQRAALSPEQQQQAGDSLLQTYRRLTALHQFTHYGIYLPHRQEIPSTALLDELLATQKSCYLPVLEKQTLQFRQYTINAPLTPNIFAIPEPLSGKIILPSDLEIVFVPLLAVDRAGHRLGSGGGFYDKCFQFKQSGQKPYLIGVGYDLQLIDNIPNEPWDVQIDMLLTESACFNFAIFDFNFGIFS